MPAANVVPTLPANAPFSPEQRAWLNGFLAGCFYDRQGGDGATVPAVDTARLPLLIAFGSQTGSAQGLAKKFAKAR